MHCLKGGYLGNLHRFYQRVKIASSAVFLPCETIISLPYERVFPLCRKVAFLLPYEIAVFLRRKLSFLHPAKSPFFALQAFPSSPCKASFSLRRKGLYYRTSI